MAPEDYRIEETGVHECEQGGLSEAQGREEGDLVRDLYYFMGIEIDVRECRDGVYVQFIRPRGPLKTNLRTQLRA